MIPSRIPARRKRGHIKTLQKAEGKRKKGEESAEKKNEAEGYLPFLRHRRRCPPRTSGGRRPRTSAGARRGPS